MTALIDKGVVLDWLRSEFGIAIADLPKGDLGDCSACPIARAIAAADSFALEVAVDHDFVYLRYDPGLLGESRDREINVPHDVSQWLQGFDKGMYPEYVNE